MEAAVAWHQSERPLREWSSLALRDRVVVVLRDGSRVRIRQGPRSDGELLRRAPDDLSPESRYRRILAPLGARSEGLLRYLTAINARAHAEGIRTSTALMLTVRIVKRACGAVEIRRPDAARLGSTFYSANCSA